MPVVAKTHNYKNTKPKKEMKQSQDYDDILKYSPGKDGIFRGEAAKGVLSYLLKDVSYRPDDPYYSLLEAVESGLPQKTRYQLQDGDYAVNEYPKTKGYYFDDKAGKYVAFDNSSNECFVKVFDNDLEAIGWLKGKFEIE